MEGPRGACNGIAADGSGGRGLMAAVPARGRVLVTGSNRGIGLELVAQYAHDGYEVIATCRDPDTATELRDLGDRVAIRRLDVTSDRDLDALVADLDGAPIDVLIANAAVFGGPRSRFADIDRGAWRDALEVNLLGSMHLATSLWPNVAAAEQGRIVFVASRAGLPREATPGRSYIYSSSKAALNSAARCFALDVAREGVIAALINPGHVRTRIGGAQAPMSPAESVTAMRKVIAALTLADAGKLFHFDGTVLDL
jgi:NAD(P)-dependent dehydrogenase (short-subunit alcohol dehydrogenase family)